jgi:hypothetical protein
MRPHRSLAGAGDAYFFSLVHFFSFLGYPAPGYPPGESDCRARRDLSRHPTEYGTVQLVSLLRCCLPRSLPAGLCARDGGACWYVACFTRLGQKLLACLPTIFDPPTRQTFAPVTSLLCSVRWSPGFPDGHGHASACPRVRGACPGTCRIRGCLWRSQLWLRDRRGSR